MGVPVQTLEKMGKWCLERLQFLGKAFSVANIRQSMKNDTILWLFGLQYVPSAILTPALTYAQLKRSNVPEDQASALMKQEVLRQGVGAAIQFATYYPALLLVAAGLKDKSRAKNLTQFMWAVVSGTLGYGILRPLVTNQLLIHWLKQEPVDKSSVLQANGPLRQDNPIYADGSVSQPKPTHVSGGLWETSPLSTRLDVAEGREGILASPGQIALWQGRPSLEPQGSTISAQPMGNPVAASKLSRPLPAAWTSPFAGFSRLG